MALGGSGTDAVPAQQEHSGVHDLDFLQVGWSVQRIDLRGCQTLDLDPVRIYLCG
jgi:hypothetical protein